MNRQVIRPVLSLALLVTLMGLTPNASGQSGWSAQTSPVNLSLSSVDFVDAQTGWVCGASGVILHTFDGGDTWATQESNTTYTLKSISFASETLGLAVGTGGTILRTADGGESWEVIRTDWMDTLYGVHFLDETHAWAVGVNAIFAPFVGRSTDGGQSWTFSTFYIQSNEATLRGVCFVNQTVGFAAATLWDGRGAVCRTTNGGSSWTTQIVSANGMFCIDMASAQTGTAAGMNGGLLRTTDGWDSWMFQSTGSGQTVRGIACPTDEIGFCVCDAGIITRTEDGGDTWTEQESGTSVALAGIDFVDTMIGTVVGAQGVILRTTTGGIPTSGVGPSRDGLITQLRLLPGGANPFDQLTQVHFEAPRAGDVRITVFDAQGRAVRSETMPVSAGRSAWTWDGTRASGLRVAPGAYFCRLQLHGAVGSQAIKTLLYCGH